VAIPRKAFVEPDLSAAVPRVGSFRLNRRVDPDGPRTVEIRFDRAYDWRIIKDVMMRIINSLETYELHNNDTRSVNLIGRHQRTSDDQLGR
jgi:hypothetical protein